MTVSRRIAFCGCLSALCMVWLFLTAFPYATIALTALAGLTLMPAALELGSKIGIACFAVTALLTLLFVPDPSAKCLYIAFFGYYPIIQLRVNLLYNAVLRRLIKAGVCAVAAVLGAGGIVFLTNTDNALSVWHILIAFPLVAVVFVVYDFALWQAIGFYRVRLHPFVGKFLR